MSRRRLSLHLVTAVMTVTIGSYQVVRAAGSVTTEYVGVTQLIVRLDPVAVTIDAVDAAAGTTVAATSSGLAGSYLLDIPAGADATATADRIRAIAGVDWVDRKSVV